MQMALRHDYKENLTDALSFEKSHRSNLEKSIFFIPKPCSPKRSLLFQIDWLFRIATEKFTRLAKAVGFKKYPDDASAYVGKELLMNLRNVDEDWKDNDGNARTTTKTVVRSYEFKNDFPQTSETKSDEAEVSPPPF